MQVELHGIGKTFGAQTVFSGITLTLSSPGSYVILGGNGSGKSTLIKILSGSLSPGEGSLVLRSKEEAVPAEDHFRLVSYAAPYLELVEEFTLTELLDFHRHFKPFLNGMDTREAISRMDLEVARHKPVAAFSSGMKQRVKLALAFFSDAPLLLLDEPLSNLDARGAAWYREQLTRFTAGRITVVGSNHQPMEYPDGAEELDLNRWK